jgi:hypothetical protein
MKINGVAYDHATLTTDNGYVLEGVKSISWSDTVESEKIRGGGRKAIDYTDGVHDVDDGSMTIEFYGWRNLIGSMGKGFMRKRKKSDWSLAYAHEGEPLVTDILKGVRIAGSSRDHEEGPDPLEVEVTLQILDVEHGSPDGGLDPFADE